MHDVHLCFMFFNLWNLQALFATNSLRTADEPKKMLQSTATTTQMEKNNEDPSECKIMVQMKDIEIKHQQQTVNEMRK